MANRSAFEERCPALVVSTHAGPSEEPLRNFLVDLAAGLAREHDHGPRTCEGALLTRQKASSKKVPGS